MKCFNDSKDVALPEQETRNALFQAHDDTIYFSAAAQEASSGSSKRPEETVRRKAG